jgi:hypothetical protein
MATSESLIWRLHKWPSYGKSMSADHRVKALGNRLRGLAQVEDLARSSHTRVSRLMRRPGARGKRRRFRCYHRAKTSVAVLDFGMSLLMVTAAIT